MSMKEEMAAISAVVFESSEPLYDIAFFVDDFEFIVGIANY